MSFCFEKSKDIANSWHYWLPIVVFFIDVSSFYSFFPRGSTYYVIKKSTISRRSHNSGRNKSFLAGEKRFPKAGNISAIYIKKYFHRIKKVCIFRVCGLFTIFWCRISVNVLLSTSIWPLCKVTILQTSSFAY